MKTNFQNIYGGTFEIIGFHVDYKLNGKHVGSIRLDKPDRKEMGYAGRKNITITEDIILKKRKYKAGTTFITECYPLCGKLINK